MNFYPVKKDHSKAAFALGLGVGIAAGAAAAYAWKKFKETHPDFNLKEYCQKCGVLSDECDFDCAESCDTCEYTEPQFEPECDFEDVEVNLEEESEESEDEEDHGTSLIGEKIISTFTANNKVLKIARKTFGEETKIKTNNTSDNMLITDDGVTHNCYMFWVESTGDDVTPQSVYYVDIVTGEVFENSENGTVKLSD